MHNYANVIYVIPSKVAGPKMPTKVRRIMMVTIRSTFFHVQQSHHHLIT